MSMPKTRALGAFAVAIVAAAGWLLATNEHATPESFAPPTTTARAGTAAPSIETSIPAPQDPAASKPSTRRSTEERAAAVKHALTSAVDAGREEVVEQLVQQGLSREDAERMGERFAEGYADCLFNATRKQLEAEGVSADDFLDRVEQRWALLLDAYNLNRVGSAMAPCIANIRQQTGISLAVYYRPVGSPAERLTPPPFPPPPWALEMENRIRDHVASRPDRGVTDVSVDCGEAGCEVMLVGHDIRIFDFDFDVFAEQHGFVRVVLRGDGKRRVVWLER